jgi:hypothetical protein
LNTNANVSLGITGVNTTNTAFRQARSNIVALNAAVGGMNPAIMRNRRLIQQAGMQMSDFAVQIAGGQSAILAFTQQVPQFVQGFGAIGGILAALITIFGTITLVAVKSGVALSQITPVMGVLQDQFAQLAPVITAVKEAVINFANLIVNNLDRIIITASAVTAFFLTRWIGAFIAARLATMSLVGALVALRGMMLRILPLAVFVAIGELIYRFMQLVEAAGGFGNALDLLKAVAVESFERMGRGLQATLLQMKGGWIQFKGTVASVLAATIDYFSTFANKVAGVAVGTVEGFKAVFSILPAALGDIMITAVNTIIEKIEGMFQAVIDGANSFTSAINNAIGTNIGQIGDADFGEVNNAFAGAGATAAGAFNGAFNSAMNTDYVGGIVTDLENYATSAEQIGSAFVKTGQHLADMNNAPMQSVQNLRDAVDSLTDTQYDVRDWFGGVEDAADGGGGGSGGDGATAAVKKLIEAFKQLKSSISGSLETMFMDIVKGTATVGDAFRKMASEIIAEMFRVMMVQHWVSSIMNGVGSLFGGFSAASGSLSGGVPGSFNVAGKRAAGGPVTGGKTYLVGEQGPELFSPSVSGSITSNGDMGGGGSVVIEQHFHISTGVQETVRAEIMGMMPVFKRQAVAAVEDARRRGQTK